MKTIFLCRRACAMLISGLFFGTVHSQNITATEWYGNARSMGMGGGLIFTDNDTTAHARIFPAEKDKGNRQQNLRGEISGRMPYAQKAMSMAVCQISADTKYADINFRTGQAGENTARENLFSLLLSRSPTTQIQYGLGGGYYRVRYKTPTTTLSDLDNAAPSVYATWFTECFFSYQINEACRFGAYLFHPNIGFYLSMTYLISPDLEMVMTLEKQNGMPIFVHIGWEKQFFDGKMLWRCGGRYPYLQPTGGWGWRWKTYHLDAAVVLHSNWICSYEISVGKHF